MHTTLLRAILAALACLLATKGMLFADPLPQELIYEEQATYTANTVLDSAKMVDINTREHPGCVMPFKTMICSGFPLTIKVTNQTTVESVNLDARIGFIPLRIYPRVTLQFTSPVRLGTIQETDIQRKRVQLRFPGALDFILGGGKEYFVWVEKGGEIGQKINVSIRLQRIEPGKNYCEVVYRVTGDYTDGVFLASK